MDQPVRAVEVTVVGQVQGVGFRAHAADAAARLGVAGWVRNTSRGDVEAYAEGPPAAVDDLLAALRQGPRWSVVDDVQVREVDAQGASGFRVR